MNKTKLIFIILGVVIVTGVVFVLGFIYGQKTAFVRLLELPMVRSVQVATVGEVIEIKNRTITIAKDNEILDIPISPDARIISFILLPEQVPKRKNLTFEDIKVNDWVDILTNVQVDGRLEGIHIKKH